MLTDIFEIRYEDRRLWEEFSERDRRFLVQANTIVTKQLYPNWNYKKEEDKNNTAVLQSVLDKVAMEVGITQFHDKYYYYTTKFNGNDISNTGTWTLEKVYENVMCAPFDAKYDADSWIKRRLSLVELAFRYKEAEVNRENTLFETKLTKAKIEDARAKSSSSLRLPGLQVDGVKALNKHLNDTFKANVDELNHRLEQARFPLSYHNGYIQIKSDQLVSDQIEVPFWELISGRKWQNVDTDMKSALDLRDTGGRDPAFYVARALESTLKIIAVNLGRATGKESGAAHFIDDLVKDKDGRFIETWEMEILKDFFRRVRNPLAHAPGSEDMVALSPHQTDWAIEAGMSWIKSLVGRISVKPES